MPSEQQLTTIVLRSEERRACLRALAAVGPAEGWLSAGFVRNAVFDSLFGRDRANTAPDLDVIYLDATDSSRERDHAFERALKAAHPGPWEVKNQVRMAVRNGHGAYRDLAHALAHFPETATAVAVRLRDERLELLAPHGVADLFAGIIRRSPPADPDRYRDRLREKRWAERWPPLSVVNDP